MIRLNDQPPKKTGKKPAPAPASAQKGSSKKTKNPLFESRPKNFGIGKPAPPLSGIVSLLDLIAAL